jgi:hypothetical protein
MTYFKILYRILTGVNSKNLRKEFSLKLSGILNMVIQNY